MHKEFGDCDGSTSVFLRNENPIRSPNLHAKPDLMSHIGRLRVYHEKSKL